MLTGSNNKGRALTVEITPAKARYAPPRSYTKITCLAHGSHVKRCPALYNTLGVDDTMSNEPVLPSVLVLRRERLLLNLYLTTPDAQIRPQAWGTIRLLY